MGIVADKEIECVEAVEWDGTSFAFSVPWEVVVRYEDGIWTHDHIPTATNGYGLTREESWAAFCEAVAFEYEAFVLADPSQLSGDARQLRAQLQKLIAHVEPSHG